MYQLNITGCCLEVDMFDPELGEVKEYDVKRDIELLGSQVPELSKITPQSFIWMWGSLTSPYLNVIFSLTRLPYARRSYLLIRQSMKAQGRTDSLQFLSTLYNNRQNCTFLDWSEIIIAYASHVFIVFWMKSVINKRFTWWRDPKMM